ncbi:MAG: hypothetical protein JNM13_11840 [Hyphomicrobiaceae bacterium]|nr:hypothetical protein [Hyphomicrobiaceae bacterium]
MYRSRQGLVFAAGLLLAAHLPGVATPVAVAVAADTSRVTVMGATLELVAAEFAGADAHAGLAIRLEPGWKTYWRYPGDSGIAPMLDWSGSRNVGAIALAFPAPHRFADPMGTSIGYKGPVVLPLAITPKDPGAAIDLRLKVDLGLCRDICVPAHGDLATRIEPGRRAAKSEADELAAFAARVPRPVALADPAAAIAVAAIEAAGGKPPEYQLTIRAPAAGGEVDVLAEGPDGWALPLPERIAAPGADLTRWRVVIDGIPRAAKIPGSPLRLTLIQGSTSVETVVPLP